MHTPVSVRELAKARRLLEGKGAWRRQRWRFLTSPAVEAVLSAAGIAAGQAAAAYQGLLEAVAADMDNHSLCE